MQRQQLGFQLPELYAAVVPGRRARLRDQRRCSARRQSALVLWVGEERVGSARDRSRGRLLGVGGLRSRRSASGRCGRAPRTRSCVPPSSAVAERAWEIWPTRDFLAGRGGEPERLAAGYAHRRRRSESRSGSLLGASRATRGCSSRSSSLLRALPPIAIVPVAIVVLGLGDAMQIAVIAFGVCFPVLVNTVEGVRAVSPEARDTASMLQVGAVERAVRALPARRAPVDRRRSPRRALDRPGPRRDLRVRRRGGRPRALHLVPAVRVRRAGAVRRASSSSACSATR